jgi:hypothetical protein
MEALVPTQAGDEPSLFAGIDTTISGLAAFVEGTSPAPLVSGLRGVADRAAAAQKQFDLGGPFAAAPSIVAGLGAVRSLRQQLTSMGLSADARFNIDARLKTKEDQFTEAAVLAHGLRVEVLADDGLVVPGQDVRVRLDIGDRGRPVSVASVALSGFTGSATCTAGVLEVGGVYRCETTVQIPEGAQATVPYWKRPANAGRYVFEPDAPFGLPFRPTPFRASITLTADSTSIHLDRPVQFRMKVRVSRARSGWS